LWDYAREARYDTTLLKKIERDDGRLGEQAVDELLHLKIALCFQRFPAPQTLILATGDGRVGEFGTSFVEQVRYALRLGWDVEVWSWGMQLSQRFSNINVSGARPKVQVLDPHYRSVTFIKGGEFPTERGMQRVAERIVERL
jgi:hypothetical protein